MNVWKDKVSFELVIDQSWEASKKFFLMYDIMYEKLEKLIEEEKERIHNE
tara:strand:- start:11543 stop:11692 length:150 start_codon:yes stop_codon:yes gene_type:complete